MIQGTDETEDAGEGALCTRPTVPRRSKAST